MDDVEQTPAEKRQLRHGYRSLLADAAARKKEYLEDSGALLLADLERANGLFGDVNNTAEGVLDSRFLLLSADVGAQRAHMLRIDSAAFDSLAYIDRVRTVLYGTDAETATDPAWGAVGKIAAGIARIAPRLTHAYGPLAVEARERRKAETSRRQGAGSSSAAAAAARIETMGTEDVRQQENQTTRLVQKVHRVLAERGPINLFELVINPQSFAQSVENIFYVSFLIRDGKAYIDDSSGQPMIEACEPPQQEDYQSGLTKKQLIFTLDQATWREIIDVYGIRQSAIPARKSVRDEHGLNAVIDLTDSPPLSTQQAQAFSNPHANAPVVISSDDERSPSLSGVTPLPPGYVLPPINRHDPNEYGRPERITTLRDILSTRNSRQRSRSMLARQRAGLHFQPGNVPGTLVPHVLPHTGDEPVEAGVYYPIRARAVLPGQRQRQQQRQRANDSAAAAAAAAAPVSAAGRETADGAIDVEEVEEEEDEEGTEVSDTSYIDDEDMADVIDDVELDGVMDEADYDSESEAMRPDETASQTIMDYLMMRREGQRMMSGFMPAHDAQGMRGRPPFMYQFPHMMSQHMRTNSHITPFDFFPGEDISNLLSFLEATTPAPPTRPMPRLEPLKLSKRQEELAALPDFSRKVPRANFRDATTPPAPDTLEIVCTACAASLFDKEPIWAPTCGHIICNACVAAITGASRNCTACKKRIFKKSLVHLYM
ncbi:hypothetical protein EV183_001786 [Coemansia sp. RSA 2336]|nr:hypothetical protein EV183_001786 [Coemansia sp. RSA 2336]